ncbi:hypothetical protein EDD86DRAFT_245238 [Gorgonomyces haynaldii]|nr:hypothetical protein EDD86DRAFT_245238 [Gorgonomyces haynaldii]
MVLPAAVQGVAVQDIRQERVLGPVPIAEAFMTPKATCAENLLLILMKRWLCMGQHQQKLLYRIPTRLPGHGVYNDQRERRWLAVSRPSQETQLLDEAEMGREASTYKLSRQTVHVAIGLFMYALNHGLVDISDHWLYACATLEFAQRVVDDNEQLDAWLVSEMAWDGSSPEFEFDDFAHCKEQTLEFMYLTGYTYDDVKPLKEWFIKFSNLESTRHCMCWIPRNCKDTDVFVQNAYMRYCDPVTF